LGVLVQKDAQKTNTSQSIICCKKLAGEHVIVCLLYNLSTILSHNVCVIKISQIIYAGLVKFYRMCFSSTLIWMCLIDSTTLVFINISFSFIYYDIIELSLVLYSFTLFSVSVLFSRTVFCQSACTIHQSQAAVEPIRRCVCLHVQLYI